MFYISLFVVSFVFLVQKVFKHYQAQKIFLLLFIVGFTIYSGIGIFYCEIDSAFWYYVQFILFSLSFFVVVYTKRNSTSNLLARTGVVCQNHNTIIGIFTLLYIFTFIYPLILGSITLSDILNFGAIFSDYTATPFSLRLARRSNLLYIILTNQVRSICTPFFYLTLYRYRKKPVVFISIFLLPVFLQTLADSYLSRNNMAVYFAFIFLYLVMEKYINKKLAIIIICISVPIIAALFNVMAMVRLGESFSFSLNGIIEEIKNLLQSECSFPRYYKICDSMTSLGRTVNFFIYILLVIVPSQLYPLIGLTIPNLAYSFTEEVLGMSYGAANYYIVLPSVLGEAIILFGSYFAWIYGLIYALLSTWFLRVLSGNQTLKYLKLYFMLDFFRQFRGGSQYVLSTWLTTILPFAVIVYVLSRYKFTFGGIQLVPDKKFSNHNK